MSINEAWKQRKAYNPQHGTLNYNKPPTLFVNNGVSQAVKLYDKTYPPQNERLAELARVRKWINE